MSDKPRTDAEKPEQNGWLFYSLAQEELTAAQAELKNSKELHDRLRVEYISIDDEVRKAALAVGISKEFVDGDSYSVPGPEELVECIVQKFTAAQAEIAKQKSDIARLEALNKLLSESELAKKNQQLVADCISLRQTIQEGIDWSAKQEAEIARLKAGGCALDQRTTQFCAEAIKLQEENASLQERVRRLEAHGSWIPASTKPKGWERKVLCWVVWPACGWPAPPEAIIGWWKHGPGCFAVVDIECADHLVTHWMEITDPSEAKDTQ